MSGAERLTRLDRILKVQGQKRLLEEWRLAHLRENHAAIERDDVSLLESLDVTSQLHGLFIETKVKGLRRNEVQRRANLMEQDVAHGAIAEARRAEKGIVRLRDDARRDDDAEAEAKGLEASLDGFLARRAPSFE